MAQGTVRGRVLDKQTDEVMQFVNVKVTDAAGKLAGGGMTDAKGQFSVEVWINGKASGLTSDNRGDILQQIPAEHLLPPHHRRDAAHPLSGRVQR